MKKIFKVLSISLLLITLFSLPISAAESEEDILDDFNELIPDDTGISTDGDLTSKIGIDAILAEVIYALSEGSGEALGFFLTVFGFAILFCISGNSGIISDDSMRNHVEIAVSAIASVSIFTSLYGVYISVRDSLTSIVDFFSSIIPVFTIISTSSGATSTASVQAVNMNITLSVLEKFCTGALLPTAFAFFAISFVGSVAQGSVDSVAKGVKSVFMWGVGVVGTVLAAAIAMQSIVASASDNAALRAARYAASGMIPIVGSTVASALSTLGGGMAFVKSTAGAATVAVILVLALAPLISLLLYRLAFSVCLIFLEFSGSTGGVRCFSAFKSSLDALIAVYSMSTLVCIIETVVFIKGGVSVS